jgi:hypothetical protein
MANYRQIHVSIWKDEWFLDLDPKHKLLFIYLFSNELASLAGIYKIPLKVVQFETELSMAFIKSALEMFEKADKAYYCDGLLWVKNLRNYNKGGSTVQTRIEKDIAAIPDCTLKEKYWGYYYPDIPYAYTTDSLSYEMKCNGMNNNEINSNDNVEDEDRPAKNFDDVQLWLEEIVRLPITQADIPAIQELTTAGITQVDIRGALQWRKENNVKPARTVGALKDGIITNRNKRIQDGSARKPDKSAQAKSVFAELREEYGLGDRTESD